MKKYDKKQIFDFELKIRVSVKSCDYDLSMKQVIDKVNKLNKGDVIIDEVKGAHETLFL